MSLTIHRYLGYFENIKSSSVWGLTCWVGVVEECHSGCASQAHCHFLEQSVSTGNSSVMDHAALCCTSNLPETFSRTPAHPVCCYSRRCGVIHCSGSPCCSQLTFPKAALASPSCAGSSRARSRCGQAGSCGERCSSLGQSDSLLARLFGSLGCADLLFLPYSRFGRNFVNLVFGAEGSAGPGSLMVQCSRRIGTCNLLSVRLFIS